jgi:hypothetical protein
MAATQCTVHWCGSSTPEKNSKTLRVLHPDTATAAAFKRLCKNAAWSKTKKADDEDAQSSEKVL